MLLPIPLGHVPPYRFEFDKLPATQPGLLPRRLPLLPMSGLADAFFFPWFQLNGCELASDFLRPAGLLAPQDDDWLVDREVWWDEDLLETEAERRPVFLARLPLSDLSDSDLRRLEGGVAPGDGVRPSRSRPRPLSPSGDRDGLLLL